VVKVAAFDTIKPMPPAAVFHPTNARKPRDIGAFMHIAICPNGGTVIAGYKAVMT
jgi:hypothetical protein